ncbi:uncharacterized protein LOC131942728 [Physella acuta]|uniref:uncharacterized protein LOC131942728 n=1 Tax=Physella acuta TaxID=109671 RepID=UPI0027DC24DF|nr:uncharacterized protein LOC131942728 [Physella acuta]
MEEIESMTTMIAEKTDGDIISDEITDIVMKLLMYIITPVIAFFGVIGNSLSIIILVKNGIHKSSNILLISLAFCNTVYLIAYNSIPKVLYIATGHLSYDGFSEYDTYLLFIFFSVFTFLDYSFGLMALSVPMLITIERLIVIFFPLSCHRIVTPERTWLVLGTVILYWSSIFVYTSFWLDIEYIWDAHLNKSIGRFENSAMISGNLKAVVAVETLFGYTSMVIPPLFTALGCIIISIKLKISSIKRKALSANSSFSQKTTKILLAVCSLYVITSAYASIALFKPEYSWYTLAYKPPTNTALIVNQICNIIGCINCSSDFVVYIVMNKNFRVNLSELFRRRLKY